MLKLETHDLNAAMHHTDAGAFPVEEYRRHEHGLYVRRLFQDHPKIHAWEAHILPELHLQICRYQPHEGIWWCSHYIDIIEAEDRGSEFHVKDLILDVAIGHQAQIHILDTDQFGEALHAGTIAPSIAATALSVTHAFLNELSQHGNDLVGLLEHNGIDLAWHPAKPA